MKRLLFLSIWPVVATMAAAADHPDLPPAAAVDRALHAHPAVRAAEAGLGVGEARRNLISAGPHEFTVKLEGQRRREVPIDVNYHESAIGIERAIRLPGKGARDAALGAITAEQARHAYGDALHETSRLLLKSWFDWRREAAAAAEWQAQTGILKRQHEAVGKRVGAGDAARLEAMLSEAQLTQAEAQLAQAQLRAELAADGLRREFPALPLPTGTPDPATGEPPRLAPPMDQWREKMLAENHELAVARTAARREQLAAQRADAERLPDPTLGLRIGRERDGQERIVGIQLSVPLPGSARAAAADVARGEADMAAAREAQTLIKVEAEAHRTLAQAGAAHDHWQRLAGVAARMEDNAALLDKAWRLGEGQFADLQLARRQAVEARLAAAQARLDAAEAYYRVLLDAHELWPLDADDRH